MNPARVSGAAPVNLMAGLRGFAAGHAAKFRDINRRTSRLHLKECTLFKSPTKSPTPRAPSNPAQIAPAKTE